ncbi:hypothetical protein ACSSS7_004567 [Eimeria intestinalis]
MPEGNEELQAAVPEAKAKVAELQEELADPRLYDEETDVEEALTILQNMKKRIDEVAAEVDRCKRVCAASDFFVVCGLDRCEDILHVDATPFEGFEETLQTFEALESCLRIKKNWSAFVDGVGEESFWSADLQKIQASLQAFTKGAQSLTSSLGSRPLFASLQTELSTFRSILVVARALRNPALKERHWIAIQELLGEEANIRDQSLLIKDLKNFRRLAETPEILESRWMIYDFEVEFGFVVTQTLSSDATAEETLEGLLHSVRQTWDSLQLPLTTRRVSKDKVVILGSLDDVIATLDDSLVSVNTIAGSRFGLFIRAEIEALQSQLTVVQEALEEWQLLQANWLGMQAIFSFPDIRKQLPSEAAKFASVDTQWRAISAELQEYNICLAACTKEGRLATLKRLNNTLEDIRRGLEDYLQASLRILNPQLQSQSAVQTSHSMVSAEGERIAFHKKFKLRGPVEKWLSDVESSMTKTLQKIIKQKKNEVYGQPEKDWIFQTPAQVAACIAQLFWTLEVEEALEGERQQLEVVHEQQLEELQRLTTLVRLPLSLLERANVSALAIQTLHNRDVVESLIRENVAGPDAFDWQKQLRHYWQGDSETLAVQQLSAVFQYGHEYLGAPQRLVITPLTDRCWLTITTALKQLCVNSSIAGPAGSGKTESVKELAKLLGLFCVVLNCSDAVDLYVLDKVFAGVMASGAWACLDEFNRLDVEVLSVVAQQLLDMRHSLLKADAGSAATAEAGANRTKDKDTFLSRAAPSPASSSCGVFVTLNPNYAGRAELPDNLQLLFRPVAMVTPDFSAIAEIIIFSEGFAESKRLAKKFVEFFKLCPDQLSPQVHYDFGLRAAKTALLLGGQLRRLDPLKSEDAAIAQAIRLTPREESVKAALHLHQLLASRRGVIVLGGAMAGKSSTITTLSAALTALKSLSLPSSKAGSGVEEETQGQNGETAKAGRVPHAKTPEGGEEEGGDEDASPQGAILAAPTEAVHCRFLNPKALDTSELLGEFNPMTKDWKDGVASAIIRDFVASENEAANQWLVFDGPIDSIWVESLNTVLDDNQMLCLPNGERIQLTPSIRLLFEVSDLSAASPATVSRCGMLFVTEHVLHWRDVMSSWFNRVGDRVCGEFTSIIRGLFELSIPPCEALLLAEGFNQEAALVWWCAFFSCGSKAWVYACVCATGRRLSRRASSVNAESLVCPYTAEQLEFLAAPAFFFCFVWTVGGGADASSQKVFSRFCEELFDEYVSLPKGGDVIDVCFNFELAPPQRLARKRSTLGVMIAEQQEAFAPPSPADRDRQASFSLTNREAMDKARRLKAYFTLWEKTIPEFRYDPALPFHSLMVPTKETLRATTLMNILAGGKIPILLTGPAGSGKTALVGELLRRKQEEGGVQIVSQTFSSLIQPAALQTLLESRLETKRKTLLGPPARQDCMVWIDDVNLPLPDAYGSQPTAELLRQMEEFKGFYDRKRIYWKGVERLHFVLSAGPSSAGRQPLPARVSRHFHLLCVSEPEELSAQRMFQCLLDAHFSYLVSSAQAHRQT